VRTYIVCGDPTLTVRCRPGDHVVWKGEDVKQPAIVQHVNATDRTAIIFLPENGSMQLASVLELDPHGSSDLAAVIPQSASEGLGVRRGDFVFIHRDGTTNGFEIPFVPRIGELEPWVREGPFREGRLAGWRKEMSDIGANLAATRGEEYKGSQIRQPSKTGGLLWIGEVTNVRNF
jgi:ubiquitin-conjugating enzyme E2 O